MCEEHPSRMLSGIRLLERNRGLSFELIGKQTEPFKQAGSWDGRAFTIRLRIF